MIRTFYLAVALFTATPALAQETPACPPAGYDRATLLQLRANEFVISNMSERERFAEALVACLADPDPVLRDQIAYEAFATMLRRDGLHVATRDQITMRLLEQLDSGDPSGVAAPFAALVLSEIVRAERHNSHFTDDQYARVLDAALRYFTSVRDYRGFDETEGWRHGVAHGADLLTQIALSDNYGPDAPMRIRDAIATQIAPEGHFYIYGEAERLARPILVLAARDAFTEEDWRLWFSNLVADATPPDSENLFVSQHGLALRHNMSAFLNLLYVNADLSENGNMKALLPGVEEAIRALP